MSNIIVTSVNIDDSELSSEIDLLSGIEANDRARERIKEEVGQYLVEQTLLAVGGAKSPISGESWKASLSPAYKKEKSEEGYTAIANLEATGDMLTSFGFETTDSGIKIGVFGSEAAKADGHNNLSGESLLPKRRFIPDEGQSYKRDIVKNVNEIINDIISEETIFTKSDFTDVSSSSDLYSVLSDILKITGRSSIQRAVLGNNTLRAFLDELDLLDLL